jgi:hypothetical protein
VKTLVAAQPDAIVQVSAYKSCAAFIRAARAAGFGGTFFNVSFVGTQALADELGKDAAGVVVSQVVPSPVQRRARHHARVPRSRQEGRRRLPGELLQHGGLPRGQGHGRGPEARSPPGPRATRSSPRWRPVRDESFGGFNVAFSPANHVASRFVELSMLTADGRVRI